MTLVFEWISTFDNDICSVNFDLLSQKPQGAKCTHFCTSKFSLAKFSPQWRLLFDKYCQLQRGAISSMAFAFWIKIIFCRNYRVKNVHIFYTSFFGSFFFSSMTFAFWQMLPTWERCCHTRQSTIITVTNIKGLILMFKNILFK